MARQRVFVRTMSVRFGRDRWNEHVKLVAGMFNAIGVACLIGAIVAPLVNGAPTSPLTASLLVLGGLSAHLLAQYVLRYIASKE